MVNKKNIRMLGETMPIYYEHCGQGITIEHEYNEGDTIEITSMGVAIRTPEMRAKIAAENNRLAAIAEAKRIAKRDAYHAIKYDPDVLMARVMALGDVAELAASYLLMPTPATKQALIEGLEKQGYF